MALRDELRSVLSDPERIEAILDDLAPVALRFAAAQLREAAADLRAWGTGVDQANARILIQRAKGLEAASGPPS